MGFLDNILGKDDDDKKKKKQGLQLKNPFQKPATFQGQGQSLGGSKPGIVIPISIPNPGPVGVRVRLFE